MNQISEEKVRQVVLPPRHEGETNVRNDALDRTVLTLLYDAGGEMPFPQLWQHLPVTTRELWRSLVRQNILGHVDRYIEDDPVRLTPAARFAISAGRQKLELAA